MTVNENDLKESITKELTVKFREFQKTTKKKLELRGFIDFECIMDELYNISVEIRYANSGRKFRNHLNFTRSETFNQNKESLNQFFTADERGFQSFVDSIIQEVEQKVKEPSAPIRKHTLTHFF